MTNLATFRNVILRLTVDENEAHLTIARLADLFNEFRRVDSTGGKV